MIFDETLKMSDLTINHSDLVSKFTNVTGIDNDRAKFYLESAAWDLQVALASFYEDDNDIVEEIAAIAQSNEFPQHTSRTDTSYSKPPPKPAQPKFGTLASLKKDDESSDEEEGQAFYAGGSERSGQQVIGPGKKKNDIVSEMFKAAKDHGAEVVDLTQEPVKAKNKVDLFKGTGYRLGATETDSSTMIHSGTSSSSSSNFGPPETVEITLKMWRNGFSIDSGPLQDYQDPSNQAFLDTIKKGEIPVELIREAKGGEVMLNMEDHRQEDYIPPKSKLKAFTGTGHLLGSPVPSVTIYSGSKDTLVQGPDGEQVAQQPIKVDDKQPVTNVQIRLADGTKVVARLNHHHTIGDLYHYVITSRPQYSATPFILMTTFPSTELTNRDLTLKQASLLNAVIVQRLQ